MCNKEERERGEKRGERKIEREREGEGREREWGIDKEIKREYQVETKLSLSKFLVFILVCIRLKIIG